MNELEQARLERDAAFAEFVKASAKATKESVRAKAARARYVLASDEVRFLEREVLSYEPLNSKLT